MIDTSGDLVVVERRRRDLYVHVNESFVYLELRNFYTHLRPYLMCGYRSRVRRFVRACEVHPGLDRAILRQARGMREGKVRYVG